jgi:hypothetical protein
MIWKDFAPISGGGVLFSAKENIPALGNLTANISNGLHPANTSITISATPLSSSFLGWTSKVVNLGTANSLSFVLTQDTVIVANFGNTDTVNLTAAGTLKNRANIKNITHLTITGNIDARDIQFMRDSIPLLSDLDLTGATIVAYSGTEGTYYDSNYTYPANEMPQYSFYRNTSPSTGKISLTSIKLPVGLITIGNSAFSNCIGLASLTIPNSVTSIGSSAFSYCSGLTSLTIPNSVISIGQSAFSNCSNLTSLTIGNSVTSIGDAAFSSCSGLTSVTIPNSVTSIGNSAFYNCSGLTFVTIGNSVTSIGYSAFQNCRGLTTVNFNATNCASMMGSSVFYGCSSFSTLTIGNNVQNIPSSAFYDCSSLTSVTIGNSVTYIRDKVFYNCSGIAEIHVKAVTPSSMGDDIFYGVLSTIPVHVPCGSAVAYRNAYGWNRFANNIIEDVSPRDISVQSNNTGMGVANIIQSNTCTNDTAIIAAIANTGYRFVQWNDGNNQNPRTITVTKDTVFTAEFGVLSANTYHVTVNANNSSMGTVSGSGDYATNTTVTIAATANTGYRFVQWNDGNSQNPRTISVTKDTVFTAEFEVILIYHVYVSANNPIMGTVSGGGDCTANSTITITATANIGYRFIQWSDGNKQSPRTITVTQDMILTAEFAVSAANMYHVTVFADDPSMGSVSGGGDYAVNSTAVIEATPNAGYRFKQWQDGNTQNPRSITVTQDIVFSAEFVSVKHKVLLSVNDITRGTVSGNGEYTINTVVTITATPYTGYRFVGWSDGNKNNTRTITVTQDIALVAIFGIEGMYYVYASPNNSVMGSVTGSNDYEKKSLTEAVHKAEYSANSTATITAIPNPGYRFVQWSDGNTTNPLSFTVTDDYIITAIFDENTGITDREASDISVYPNPARDHITVILPENIHQAVFTLYDMQGKLLLQQEINNQDVISVNTFAKGIYLYNITTDKQKHVGKLRIKN